MQRSCDGCGRHYEAKRVTSRWCGSTCRTQASRSGASSRPRPVSVPSPAPSDPPPAAAPVLNLDDAAVTQMTAQELEAAGRLHTMLGRAAIVLAQRIDNSHRDTGSAVAGMVKQLQATMAAATAGSGKETSAVDRARDDLAARRARAQRGA